MVRRQFKEQVRVVAEGGNPVGVYFDEADRPAPLIAGNYIVDADSDHGAIPARRNTHLTPDAAVIRRQATPDPPVAVAGLVAGGYQ